MALGGMDLGYGLENLIDLARTRRPQSSDLVRDLPVAGPMPVPDVRAPGGPLPEPVATRPFMPVPGVEPIPADPVATTPGGPVPGAEPLPALPVAPPEELSPLPPVGGPRGGRIVKEMMRERQPETRVVEGER